MKSLLTFFKNIYRFRKELWEFRRWDYCYNLKIFKQSLQLTHDYIDKYGYEIDETKIPKLRNLKDVIRRLNYELNLKYFDEVDRLGLKEPKINIISKDDTFSEVEFKKDVDNYYNKCDELENRNWKRIWEIISKDMKGWWD